MKDDRNPAHLRLADQARERPRRALMPTQELDRTELIDMDKVLGILGLNPRDPAVQAMALVCDRYHLDPLLKHAVIIENKLYVTRDGLLHVAHRSGVLDGIEVVEQSETDSHFVAKVAVYRKDMSHPFVYVGRFPKQRKVKREGQWKTEAHPYGPEMAVKCGEVMAMRRAFDIALAAREEMWDTEPTSTVEPGIPDRDVETGTPTGGSAESPAVSEADSPVEEQTAVSASDPNAPATKATWDRAVELIGSKAKVVEMYRDDQRVTGTVKVSDITEAELMQLIMLMEPSGMEPTG